MFGFNVIAGLIGILIEIHEGAGFSSNSARPKPSIALQLSNGAAGLHGRPLLRKFGRGIQERIIASEQGHHLKGEIGAYSSKETIPRLDMQCSSLSATCSNDPHVVAAAADDNDRSMATRREIREAFSESQTTRTSELHGRSSGSGCVIIRLHGDDATSINNLTRYAQRFFEQVDNDKDNKVSNAGVFRIDKYVYAGFDDNVNGEGKMQFLDTRMFRRGERGDSKADTTTTLLPMELENLVGTNSIGDAHKGMNTLLDIGTQITSAVLGMTSQSSAKLIDDGDCTNADEDSTTAGDQVSNSYHRLIRYLKPQSAENRTAFDAHVDSSFLTLIPMPDLPGLEIWCPSRSIESDDSNGIGDEPTSKDGEWVRPTNPSSSNDIATAHIIVLAGSFLQLTSDGKVPTCIHRVIPRKPPPCDASDNTVYRPRVSAPLFLRPRRGKHAMLDVANDLRLIEKQPSISSTQSTPYLGLYHEKGLLEECDDMHLWSAHDVSLSK